MDILLDEGAHGLDKLPTELLHRIASHLPIFSVLNLCFVNRTLYTACYDRLIFRQCAVNAIFANKYYKHPALDDRTMEDWELESCPSEASEERSEDEEWWPDLEEEELSEEDDWDYSDWGITRREQKDKEIEDELAQWRDKSIFNDLSAADSARIAFAVGKAQSFFNVSIPEQRKDWSPEWVALSFKTWLPHLIALRHPSCLMLKPETLQLVIWEPNSSWSSDRPGRNPQTDDYITVGFCIIALMLLRVETFNMHRNSGGSDVTIEEPFYMNHPECMGIMDDVEWWLKERDVQWQIEISDSSRDRYSLMLYMLMMSYPHHTAQDIPFPSLYRIPFIDTLGIPVPFSTPPDVFSTCLLSGSNLVEYLSGEWTGRCTDREWPNYYHVGPQFKYIHFSARLPNPSDPPETAAIIEDTSCGYYNRGPFTIGGRVSTNGTMRAIRHYLPSACRERTRDHYGSDFVGFLTPFGIVGSWETSYGPHPSGREMKEYNGFFWFWKKEWCVEGHRMAE